MKERCFELSVVQIQRQANPRRSLPVHGLFRVLRRRSERGRHASPARPIASVDPRGGVAETVGGTTGEAEDARVLTFGSLFAGIGGFDLGFERSGLRCEWQVEKDEFCSRVLAKHWPDVRRWGDVCTFPPSGEWGVDVICGGFPCQGISAANGQGGGLDDERSGLWFEFARIVRELRPAIVVLENVPAITFRGLDTVLANLSEIGLDAEWNTLSSEAMGAPHGRERFFAVAYRTGVGFDPNGFFCGGPFEAAGEKQASRIRLWPGQCESSPALPDRTRWMPPPGILRVADGLPSELDKSRIKSLGNAVDPNVAEWIGKRIIESLTTKE